MKEVKIPDGLKTKFPEQVVMGNAYTPSGRANTMTFGWAMSGSGSPPYYVLAVGKTRYTMECIDAHRAFVVSFPSVEQEAAMLLCGTKSGREMNKETDAGLTFRRATKVDAPLIVGAVANLECRLVHKYDCGDHYLVVGEIVAAHVEPGKRRLYNLGGGRFGGIKAAASEK